MPTHACVKALNITREGSFTRTDAEPAIGPETWSASLSGAPVLDRTVPALVPVLVRRWRDIAPEMEHSALDQHFISVHLGGAKRLFRRGEGGLRTRDVPENAYSIVPAGSAFRWDTHGPVDFAHIYFKPTVVRSVIANAFDRDPSHVQLEEGLGDSDPLIGSLALALLDELGSENTHPAYLDDLTHLLLCRILRLHSNARTSATRARQTLAPFRLRRALDFIESHLAEPIGVTEIAAASGISAFHFSRAFRQSTGRPPYSYLIERRVATAKLLLAEDGAVLATVAQRCGFASPGQFSRMFQRAAGATPKQYRDQR